MKKTTYLSSLAVLTVIGLVWYFGAGADSISAGSMVIEYNATTEYALTQGGTTGVWNYGSTPSEGSDVVTLYPNASTVAQCSASPGTDFQSWATAASNGPHMGRNISGAPFNCGSLRIPTDAIYMHPGEGGGRTVLRWTAPSNGTYQLTGVLEGLNPPGVTDFRVLKNSTGPALFSGANSGLGSLPFNFAATVVAGDTIDFSLGWGNGTWNSDGSGLAVTIGPPVTACQTKPANQQVWLPGENSTTDVESLNNNASLVGDAAYTNTGKVGRAFDFDGTGDYVRVEDHSSQRPTNQLTIEGWFRFDSLAGLPHLVSKPLRSSPFNSYALWYDAGNIRIGYYDTNNSFIFHDTGYSPPLGVWNHYAMVLNTDDTGPTANTLKLYLNGVESFSGAANGPVFYNGVNDSYQPYPLLIGADFENNNPQFFLDGAADEVSIYGRALTQPEIFDLVQQGSFGKCPPAACAQAPNGLVSWYSGDQKDYRPHLFFQDFSSNMNGVAPVGGTVVLESGQLRTTAPGGGEAIARITAAQSVPVKFSALVTATTLLTEGPELRVTDASGTIYTVDYFHQSQQLRIIRNGSVLASVPAVLPLNTQTPMSLEIVTQAATPTLTARLGSAVAMASNQDYRTITQFDLTGYFNGESGLWDNVQIGDSYALDSKSNNHGTPFGGSIVAGKVGNGMKFDGTDDLVQVPDNSTLNPANLTLETWLKFDSLTSTVTGGAPAGYQNIIFKKNSRIAGTGFEGGYSLVKNPDNKLGLGFNSPSGGTDFANSTTVMQAGVWYHIVGTHDGTNVRLYVDGQLEGTGTATFPIDYGTTPLYLGNSQVPFSGYFNGVLDETSIYNRALSATEISSLYNTGSSGKCKPSSINPTANQVAWFTGDGDTRDFTGLNANGTLVGDTNYRVGRVAQAFSFDGNGDYISSLDSANWDFGTGNFAIEGWFNTPSGTGVQRIISAGSMADAPNNLWSLGYGDIGAWGGGQRINLAVHTGSGAYADFSSANISIRPNTWHHAAVVRSGTTFTFYFDGLPAGTVAVGAGFVIDGGSTGAILGARYNNNPATIFEYANGMLDEVSVYKRAATGSEINAIYNAGVAGKLKSAATAVNAAISAGQVGGDGRAARKTIVSPPGFAPTVVQLTDATVTFAQVTTPGMTIESGVDLGMLPRLPLTITVPGLSYDISTTTTFTTARVCFNLPSIPTESRFNLLRIVHLESGIWQDKTDSTSVVFATRTICTRALTSLSPFAIVEGLAPVAAGVSISGRVTTANGNGINGAVMTLTDSGGTTRRVRTGSFGYYRFDEVIAGENYVVSVASKRFTFPNPSRIVNAVDEVTDIDFIAVE